MNKLASNLLQTAERKQADLKIAPSLERRRLRSYILLLIADAALFQASFALAAYLYEGRWNDPSSMLLAQVMLPVFYTIALYNGTYGVKALTDWVFAAKQAITALLISAALLNFVAFYTKSNADFSRVSTTLGLFFAAVFIVAFRRLVVGAVQKFWGGRVTNKLVIYDGGPAFALEDAVRIEAADYRLDPDSEDPFMLDRLGKLLRNQDKVVVSCPYERREQWAFLLKSSGVYGELVSETAHRLAPIGVHRYDDQGKTTLVVSSGPLGLRGRIVKRLFDLIVAGGAVIVLSPLLLVVAALIKLEDGGKVLFVQRRMGRGNQFFDMFKFRSMREEKLDANGERSTGREDDRITRIGSFIRKTSIDELPQIFNVLRGEMSIVGPRPHALGSKANNKLFWQVDKQYWRRHCLKPGLTGLAQVRGHRGATEQEKDLTDRLQSDLEYIANWSLRRDIGIVLRTLKVLHHDNAY
ncbi:MAG: sugar transferase [Erythrobacter sp. SCN 62-14]|mgnify:CR=1 FL=1|nr:MAG: sugar transferase [Erythrobacter sp. SCN 62-14]